MTKKTWDRVPFPRVVRIEPSSACNLSCSHCPTGTVDMARGLMKRPTFERVLEALERQRGHVDIVVLYHGGEPLLNKRFPKMLAAIKAAGVPFVKTVSNGMLMTSKRIPELLESGLDAIEFSLDGGQLSENDFVRRQSDGATVIRHIRALIDAKRAAGSELPAIAISQTRFLDPSRSDPRVMPQVASYLRQAFSGPYDGEIEFKTTWAMRWPHMKVDPKIYDIHTDTSGPKDEEDLNLCDHVENTITIASDGAVLACCYDLTHCLVMGKVDETELEAIWNGSSYQELRRSIADKDYLSICRRCNTVRRPQKYLVMKPGVIPVAVAS
ncbi:MAG: radical SAM protein [Magnetococcales bacterium]|nr:radical SAM protein [Magnetococcales bacterium]